jgi:small-conductance mechanosensitive channel
MRSVVGSVVALAIVLVGVYAALEILGVARAVLSVVGLAGAVALALSFAFRDFAENFIASLLLGFRRPFGVGDVLEVEGFMGVVRALNTRATVLVTAEGNQVRIPNAMVFKNVMVNRTASDAKRYTFDVLIAHDASVTEAQRAIAEALAGHDGLLQNPKPRALVQDLEPGGVRIRSYFWLPGRGVDDLKLQSDARLRAKVALQDAGVALPQATMAVRLVPAPLAPPSRPGLTGRKSTAAREEASTREHQRLDSVAASESSAAKDAQPSTFDQALNVARDLPGDEGENLLKDGK